MKTVYAFESPEEGIKYEPMIRRLMMRLHTYEAFLRNAFSLTEVPKAVVWTSETLATEAFSDIPLPAYTRQDLIFMTPDLDAWKRIMIAQMGGESLPEAQVFYESAGEEQLLDILAHELTHHIDLFPDDFDDEREDTIWFEEGMCFYLPRRYLLGESYMQNVTAAEDALANALRSRYGNHPLDQFGMSSYKGSIPSIMFDYWRSYLAVKELVDRENGNVHAVFRKHREWDEAGREQSLTEFFGIKSEIYIGKGNR